MANSLVDTTIAPTTSTTIRSTTGTVLLNQTLNVPSSHMAYKELRVSPFSRSSLLELSKENDGRRRVIINEVIETYSKAYPPGSLESSMGVMSPIRIRRPISIEASKRNVAFGGVYIDNELHTPSSHLSYKKINSN